jgi:hypothetical protein
MADEVTGREVVLARIEVASRLGAGYVAEAQGLVDSLQYPCPLSYSADPMTQATYQRGFAEGREILRAHGADVQEVA